MARYDSEQLGETGRMSSAERRKQRQMQVTAEELRDDVRSGRCVLLVGAGVSQGSAPTTDELRAALTSECKRADISCSKNDQLDRIAERLYRGKPGISEDPARLTKAFLRAFEDHLDDDVCRRITSHRGHRATRPKPTAVHTLISELPFQRIVTTNYDTFLERAVDATSVLEPWCVANDDDLSCPPPNWGRTNRTQIIKMHGCLTAIQRQLRAGSRIDGQEILTHYVLSTSQYARFFQDRPLVASLLELWFATRPLLIIGYSMRDLNFQRILQEAREIGTPPTSYAIMQEFEAVDERFWKERNVIIHKFDAHQFLREFTGVLFSRQQTSGLSEVLRGLHAYWQGTSDAAFPRAVYAAALKGEFDVAFLVSDNGNEKRIREGWLQTAVLTRAFGPRGFRLAFPSRIRTGLLGRMRRLDLSDDSPDWEPNYEQAWEYWSAHHRRRH